MDENSEFQIVGANDYSLGPILDVHHDDYIRFLANIYQEWVDAGLPKDACIGDTFAQPSFVDKMDPDIVKKNANKSCGGKMGYYVGDMSISFVKGHYCVSFQVRVGFIK
jgi:acetoin utilization deacetylase AcuC-like enzyme